MSANSKGFFNTRRKICITILKHFLEPALWNILINGTLPNLLSFVQSFSAVVYPDWHRYQWKGRGLFSGVMHRFYEIFDTNKTGKISFNEFAQGVHCLTNGTEEQRLRLCYKFCDVDNDGLVSFNDLEKAMNG